MDYLKFAVSNQKDESISIQRVKNWLVQFQMFSYIAFYQISSNSSNTSIAILQEVHMTLHQVDSI